MLQTSHFRNLPTFPGSGTTDPIDGKLLFQRLSLQTVVLVDFIISVLPSGNTLLTEINANTLAITGFK